MSKAGVPHVSGTGNATLERAIQALKQNQDQAFGMARGMRRLDPLPKDATLEQVIARINEITERLQ